MRVSRYQDGRWVTVFDPVALSRSLFKMRRGLRVAYYGLALAFAGQVAFLVALLVK